MCAVVVWLYGEDTPIEVQQEISQRFYQGFRNRKSKYSELCFKACHGLEELWSLPIGTINQWRREVDERHYDRLAQHDLEVMRA